MRLLCPNCGARYEVDDRVIPDGGRDVQCSNCGHAWFQRPADWEEETPDPDAVTPVEEASTSAEIPVPELESEPDLDDAPDLDEEPDLGPAPNLPRREMDPQVRDILSQEAERELQARASEGVEVQPDLGLDAVESPEEERRRIARERMARMRGIEEGESLEPEVAPEPAPEPEPEPEPRPRKDLFPDIEEINSTLDSHSKEVPTPVEDMGGASAVEAEEPKRGSFIRSFAIILIIAGVAAWLYVLSPKIVEMFPFLYDPMVGYVDAVNALLGKIDGWLQLAIEKMEAAASAE